MCVHSLCSVLILWGSSMSVPVPIHSVADTRGVPYVRILEFCIEIIRRPGFQSLGIS
jgi:hypothetical protein